MKSTNFQRAGDPQKYNYENVTSLEFTYLVHSYMVLASTKFSN